MSHSGRAIHQYECPMCDPNAKSFPPQKNTGKAIAVYSLVNYQDARIELDCMSQFGRATHRYECPMCDPKASPKTSKRVCWAFVGKISRCANRTWLYVTLPSCPWWLRIYRMSHDVWFQFVTTANLPHKFTVSYRFWVLSFFNLRLVPGTASIGMVSLEQLRDLTVAALKSPEKINIPGQSASFLEVIWMVKLADH